jgi:hypothetical protein
MTECGQGAVLIVTMAMKDTSTTVARSRVELRCDLESGHAGPHRDSRHDEEWQCQPGPRPTLLRQEDEYG